MSEFEELQKRIQELQAENQQLKAENAKYQKQALDEMWVDKEQLRDIIQTQKEEMEELKEDKEYNERLYIDSEKYILRIKRELHNFYLTCDGDIHTWKKTLDIIKHILYLQEKIARYVEVIERISEPFTEADTQEAKFCKCYILANGKITRMKVFVKKYNLQGVTNKIFEPQSKQEYLQIMAKVGDDDLYDMAREMYLRECENACYIYS